MLNAAAMQLRWSPAGSNVNFRVPLIFFVSPAHDFTNFGSTPKTVFQRYSPVADGQISWNGHSRSSRPNVARALPSRQASCVLGAATGCLEHVGGGLLTERCIMALPQNC